MIARLWTGQVPNQKADAYLTLMREVAIPDYKSVDGNKGAWCLHRQEGNLTTVTMLTFWRDMDAIKAFAGDQPEIAKYYDFDPGFLIAMSATVDHFEMIDG